MTASIAMTACSKQAVPTAIPEDAKIEQQVEELLSKMDLDAKIGQMTELAIDVLGETINGEFQLDEAKLHKAIAEYKVGSFLNAPGPVAQSPEKWNEIIGRIQELSMTEIGIPCIYGLDQNHGTTYTLGGTLFPQNINMGAAFNPDLTYEAARVTAYETRASNCPWTYSPTVDMARDPRWPRVWENYGEDCYVNAEMGKAAVEGFQGEDPNHIGEYNVAACMKHYMGYGVPVSGKDRTPSSISRSDMREKHFAPFLEAIRHGALSVMVNSGVDNGIPFHANHELLTEWLKEGLNWDGMIVTDWADINNLCTRDHIAATKKEANSHHVNPCSLALCGSFVGARQHGRGAALGAAGLGAVCPAGPAGGAALGAELAARARPGSTGLGHQPVCRYARPLGLAAHPGLGAGSAGPADRAGLGCATALGHRCAGARAGRAVAAAVPAGLRRANRRVSEPAPAPAAAACAR